MTKELISLSLSYTTSNLDNTKGWVTRMKNALKNRVDCNVILVDWSKGANRDYFQSAGNTQLVGAQVGELIRFLISSAPGSPSSVDKFYVIGFSLGAQAAGYAGTYLKDEASMTLGRITGSSGKKNFYIPWIS